jgi:hypothetical protein
MYMGEDAGHSQKRVITRRKPDPGGGVDTWQELIILFHFSHMQHMDILLKNRYAFGPTNEFDAG